MKRLAAVAILAALCAGLALPAVAQQQTQFEYASYWIIYATRGPNWESQNSESGMEARMEIIEGLRDLYAKGEIIIAGLINDGSDAEFVIILQTEDEMGLRKRLQEGKYVSSGFFNVEVHAFHAPAGLKLEPIMRK